MSLYKILIVDDEAEVREAIVKKLDWNSLGFEVVADAENGLDALEKAESLDLDVVLTDLRMPFMGGLEMAARLRERNPAIKLVIFSGFDEFEYAKEAIKLKVSEYILKPVNAEELSAVLKRVKNTLDEEIEHKRNLEILKNHYDKSIPVIRLRYLTDLIRGNISDSHEDITAYLNELQVEAAGGGKYFGVTVAKINANYSCSARDWEMLCISVCRMIEENLEGVCRYTTWIYRAQPVVITAHDSEEDIRRLLDAMNSACRECRRILDVTLTLGVGKLYPSFKEIHSSYNEGAAALDYRKVIGSSQAIYSGDVSNEAVSPVCFQDDDEKQLIDMVKFGSDAEIAKLTETLAKQSGIGGAANNIFQMYAIGVLNTLFQLMDKYSLSMETVFDTSGNYLQVLFSIYSEKEFSDWLFKVITRIREGISKNHFSATQNLIMKAKRIIEEEYADQGLSAESICQRIHISPSYFSTVFKQETGTSYVNYLTEIRMKKAAELLETTDDKTYIIALKVGYAEPNYFSYVFKKQFGVSPSKYHLKER